MDCTGKRIAYTGTSMTYDRQAVYSAIRAAKGEIDEKSVTIKTDLLIVGDVNPNGSKYKNAKKHGTTIVPVAEFMAQAYNGAPWAYPPPTQRKDKPVKVKPNKELNKALRAISRETGLTGFVGF